MDFIHDCDVSDTHFDEIMDLLKEEEMKGKIPETLGTPLTNDPEDG